MPTATLSLADVIAEAQRAVVRITTADGSGSGFIYDKTGWVLTNAHVVGEVSEVTVIIGGRSRFTGQVVGVNEQVDLAVVKISAPIDLPVLTLADTGSVRIGEDVIAIGFPISPLLGTDPTVTKGVLSAQRSFRGVAYVQTDAPINPGSSGGPLLTTDGSVVGVNTAKVESVFSRPIEGIGLAISVETVAEQIPILGSGQVVRASVDPTATPTPVPSAATTTPAPGKAEVFGPINGALDHDPDDQVVPSLGAGVELVNVVAEARFYNPYPRSTGDWSAGFRFRVTGLSVPHSVFVRNDGRWYHYGPGDGQNGLVQSQQSDEIVTGPLGSNLLRVVALDDEGWLFINGRYAGALDLGGPGVAGDVEATVGFLEEDEVRGQATSFEGFSVSAIQAVFGPATGGLAHRPERGVIATHPSGVSLYDAIVEIRLFNPYPTSTGAWSSGVLLRSPRANYFHAIVLHSGQVWVHDIRTGTPESTAEFQERQAPFISVVPGGSNHIRLIALGDRGWLFINRTFAGELDLLRLSEPGGVLAITGYYTGSVVAGHSTFFQEFAVYSLGE